MDEDAKMKPRYRMCDIESMCTTLAEHDWKKATSEISISDLYEITVSPIQGEGEEVMKMGKQIRPKWAGLFFDIRNQYMQLVMTFVKEE